MSCKRVNAKPLSQYYWCDNVLSHSNSLSIIDSLLGKQVLLTYSLLSISILYHPRRGFLFSCYIFSLSSFLGVFSRQTKKNTQDTCYIVQYYYYTMMYRVPIQFYESSIMYLATILNSIQTSVQLPPQISTTFISCFSLYCSFFVTRP